MEAAGLKTDKGLYAVPSRSGAAQTLTHLGNGYPNTNWFVPAVYRYASQSFPTVSELLLPQTASAITQFPVKNIKSANKPQLGDIFADVMS